MANFRNIHMSFWTDAKVEDDFTPEDKYIYLWCLTNPHTNICGCYEVSMKQIAHETGYNKDAVEKVIRRLDEARNVIRYNANTKELLVLNWWRYNWSASEKLDKPLLAAIQTVKADGFREYLTDIYYSRMNVRASGGGPASAGDGHALPASEVEVKEPQAPPEKKVRHKRGKYGWVLLTDEEYARLSDELGATELLRCIDYVDESAQATDNKNKWKDWNLVIRRCHRDGWGRRGGGQNRPSSGTGTIDALMQLHDQFEGEGQ